MHATETSTQQGRAQARLCYRLFSNNVGQGMKSLDFRLTQLCYHFTGVAFFFLGCFPTAANDASLLVHTFGGFDAIQYISTVKLI